VSGDDVVVACEEVAGRPSRRLRRLPLLAVLFVVAGCGAPPADLFVVSRTGTAPLRLLVSDGTVRCNGGPEQEISSDDLLDARAIATDLSEVTQDEIPRTPARISSFRVRFEQRTLSFSDTTRRPDVLPRLVAFTLRIARSVCRVR
jgi:hypothetical protein